MASDGQAIFNALLKLDAALASAKKPWPKLSPYWRRTIENWLLSGKKQLVVRCGRRGGKSSSLCRLAGAVAIAGDHNVTPGDIGYVTFLSTSKEEATARLRMIKSMLDTLNVKHKLRDGIVIELQDRPIAFRVVAATVAGVSGFTSIAVIADEVAKWRDGDSGSNPANEVLASVRPTLATQPNGRIVLSSSAFSIDDAHARAIDAGCTEFQDVAVATTWQANPTLTEASCRVLEPDPRLFDREYASIPSAVTSSTLDAEDINAAFVDPSVMSVWRPCGQPVVLCDASGGGGDAWAWCSAGWFTREADEDAQRANMPHAMGHVTSFSRIMIPAGIELEQLDFRREGYCRKLAEGETITASYALELRGRDGIPLPNPSRKAIDDPRALVLWDTKAVGGRGQVADELVRQIAGQAHALGSRNVVGDQWGGGALESLFKYHALRYQTQAWSNVSKTQALTHLRALLRERTLFIVNDGEGAERMRSELLGLVTKLSPSGFETYGARRGGHDDAAALAINAAMLDASGLLQGGPVSRSREKHIIHGPAGADDDSEF